MGEFHSIRTLQEVGVACLKHLSGHMSDTSSGRFWCFCPGTGEVMLSNTGYKRPRCLSAVAQLCKMLLAALGLCCYRGFVGCEQRTPRSRVAGRSSRATRLQPVSRPVACAVFQPRINLHPLLWQAASWPLYYQTVLKGSILIYVRFTRKTA